MRPPRSSHWAGLSLAFALMLLSVHCSGPGNMPAGVLFQDDFSNPRSGWGSASQPESDRNYVDGTYFIQVYQSNWFNWTTFGQRFSDAAVEVDTRLRAGSVDNNFGLVCRQVDADNFYYFAVSSDGYYGIFLRWRGTPLRLLTGDGSAMLPSTALQQGQATNRIRAVCDGSTLSLYANGVLLGSVTDDHLTEGEIGLGVGSGPAGDVGVQFDNFLVTIP